MAMARYTPTQSADQQTRDGPTLKYQVAANSRRYWAQELNPEFQVILPGNQHTESSLRATVVPVFFIVAACSGASSMDGAETSNGAESASAGAAPTGMVMPMSTTEAPKTSTPGMTSAMSANSVTGTSTTNAAGAPAAGAAGAGMSGASNAAAAGSDGAANTGAAGAAGSGDMASADPGAAMPSTNAGADGKLPHVDMVEGAGLEDAVMGPWGPAVKMTNIPPGGWLVYPEDIGKDGVKHPIFIFGPGGGTNPQYYDMNGKHWDHYSSYGFVVYIAAQSSFSSTAALDNGLTWTIAQNDEPDSPLYQHLDTSRVGAAGHSQGSVMVFNFMPDDRVTTTIHISGGSSGGSGPANLSADTMFLCGPSSDVAYAQCETDFDATKVPTFYTNILEASHTTSGRFGWGAIVAWLLWHLADHEEWKKEFLEPDGQFQTGRYTSKIKNW